MDQSNDHGYCVARAELARDFAQRALDPAVSAAHAQLAAHYSSPAEQPERQGSKTDNNQAA